MVNVSASQAIKLIGRGIRNYATKRALVVAYEVSFPVTSIAAAVTLGSL